MYLTVTDVLSTNSIFTGSSVIITCIPGLLEISKLLGKGSGKTVMACACVLGAEGEREGSIGGGGRTVAFSMLKEGVVLGVAPRLRVDVVDVLGVGVPPKFAIADSLGELLSDLVAVSAGVEDANALITCVWLTVPLIEGVRLLLGLVLIVGE